MIIRNNCGARVRSRPGRVKYGSNRAAVPVSALGEDVDDVDRGGAEQDDEQRRQDEARY
jgi:hypothetical protein